MIKFRFILFSILFPLVSLAQTPFERLGQKAMMSGDFANAALYFEKAFASDNTNVNALYLMGYAYYHAEDYRKSINSFDKLVSLKPTEPIAYYYRGKAKTLLCAQIEDYKSPEKEKLLLGAIKDFSIGIDLNPSDMKFYQNRGLAYQDYSIYKSQKVDKIYNRNQAVSAANASINDLKKVMADSGGRRDVQSQIEKSRQLLQNNQ